MTGSITKSARVVVATTLLCIASLAGAQNPLPGRDFPTDGQGVEIWRKGNLVGIPGAASGPTIGFAVGGALVNRFRTDSGSPESGVGVGAFISTNSSWAVGAGTMMHVAHDSWRPAVGAAYYNLHYDFFGVGVPAGDRDVSEDVLQKGEVAIVQALYRLQHALYIGPRYRYARFNWEPDKVGGDAEITTLVNDNSSYRVSAFGAALTFDTRDNDHHPHHGAYSDAYAMFSGKGLGASANFQQYDGAISDFVALPKDQVLGLRLRACGVSDQTPIQELCLFGLESDLRGYAGGQYRDQAMLAGQAEWRVPFGGGFGAVAFAGLGSIADSWSRIFKIGLPSVGLGARYNIPFFNETTLGVDYAYGRSSGAFYFRVGEAF